MSFPIQTTSRLFSAESPSLPRMMASFFRSFFQMCTSLFRSTYTLFTRHPFPTSTDHFVVAQDVKNTLQAMQLEEQKSYVSQAKSIAFRLALSSAFHFWKKGSLETFGASAIVQPAMGYALGQITAPFFQKPYQPFFNFILSTCGTYFLFQHYGYALESSYFYPIAIQAVISIGIPFLSSQFQPKPKLQASPLA